ncbi:GNAT family N-acetyltransferase [Snodgrassella gandavensis]|uniref:GNAT family N-acetyltransferase n=1 Tax=Snodgrassella gandavensis TaxID=2946698 RepID=UPI0034DFDF19
MQERLEKQDSAIFIAYHQQQACGFVQLYFSFSSLSISPTIILNDLYIPVSHRQKGIATQLMQYVKKFARDGGYSGISSCTANDNHKARALYEQAGYQIDEQFVYYSLNLK